MKESTSIRDRIFSVNSDREFNALALEIFHYQRRHNPVYRRFVSSIASNADRIDRPADIPFLPIEAFKNHRVFDGDDAEGQADAVFTSTGTTGLGTSRHYVRHSALYESAFRLGFERFYGSPSDYRILALLPSYLEREGSSLIHMMQGLIDDSRHPDGGFFLHDVDRLRHLLQHPDPGVKTLLVGVSFALLDLVEAGRLPLQNTVVMETGGMKGRRKEPVREQLHAWLKTGFGLDAIHSEYGMTELLSQAYSRGGGIFDTPPWMRFLVRDSHDPLSLAPAGRTGGLNVIDLANLHSCSFIATSDLARQTADGRHEILGRMDHSDLRGCNLMVGW